MENPSKDVIENWFKNLQDSICSELENLDGAGKFQEDLWNREAGGGGRTRTIKNGDLIEKGGVNFSAVHGPTPSKILEALNLQESDFFATGVSIVLHPKNPWVPIIHMNVRYFQMSNGIFWFGGGIDLTPHIINSDDARKFHIGLKKICDRHHADYYSRFKNWADDYFYLSHRKETRGVGGIFFDRLNSDENLSKVDVWEFVKDVGSNFVSLYSNVVNDRNKPANDSDYQWQQLRRGRYVEFNLVHDKGTKFGLDTDGRTESILVSMPPQAKWEYEHVPQRADFEATQNLLKKGIDWTHD